MYQNWQYRSIYRCIRKANLSITDSMFFDDYFKQLKVIQADPKWDWNTILKATNISHPSFRRQLKSLIVQKVAEANTAALDEHSVVYITGDMQSKKRELTEKIQRLGAKRLWKYKDNVTHVVIGMNSKDCEWLADKSYIPTTEMAILQQYENEYPGFLQIQSEDNSKEILRDNLLALLHSNDPGSVKVAVEMIRQGGLPEGLFEGLLLVNKMTNHAAIRKVTKPLLELHAPEEWRAVALDNLTFVLGDTARSSMTFRRKLRKLAKRTSPEISVRFACLVYQYKGKDLRYALTGNHKKSVRMEAYRLLYKDGCFDFSAGLEYSRRYYSSSGGVKLPVDALELGEIHTLNLSSCGYQNMSSSIKQFKDLRELNLSDNDFEEFPAYVLELQKLEQLDLSKNPIQQFPEFLSACSTLKEVNFQDTYIKKVPEYFSQKLPDCTIVLS